MKVNEGMREKSRKQGSDQGIISQGFEPMKPSLAKLNPSGPKWEQLAKKNPSKNTPVLNPQSYLHPVYFPKMNNPHLNMRSSTLSKKPQLGQRRDSIDGWHVNRGDISYNHNYILNQIPMVPSISDVQSASIFLEMSSMHRPPSSKLDKYKIDQNNQINESDIDR